MDFRPIDIQGKMEEYFAMVYANNIEGIKSLIDQDIHVKSEVIVNGQKMPPVEFIGREKLLEVISKIKKVLDKIKKNSKEYPVDPKFLNDKEIVAVVEFEQELIVFKECEDENNQSKENAEKLKMYSKGQQILTYSLEKARFVSLQVIETDKTCTPYNSENKDEVKPEVKQGLASRFCSMM